MSHSTKFKGRGSSLHFLCRGKDHGTFPAAWSPERALRKPGASMKALHHSNNMTSLYPKIIYWHTGMEPQLFHNAPNQMCNEHELREYLLLPHGKLPNGDHICLTDGESDRLPLDRSNGVSLSYSLFPESIGAGNSWSGQTFVFVPFRWLVVFLCLWPSSRHRGLCLHSHADATQTEWPQKIAAFPPRPISLSFSQVRHLGSGETFQEPDCHIYPFFHGTQALLSVIYGGPELQQVKEVFASMPVKRRLMVCRSCFDVALPPWGCKMCLLLKPSILFSHPFHAISVSLDFPSLHFQLYPPLSLSLWLLVEISCLLKRSESLLSEPESSPLEDIRLHSANGCLCPRLIHAVTELGNVNKSPVPSESRSHSYSGENKEESLTRCLAVSCPPWTHTHT